MSTGDLCKSRVFVTDSLNSLAGNWIRCGCLLGHAGKHSVSLICVQNNRLRPTQFDNHRVGTIAWDDTLADKQASTVRG